MWLIASKKNLMTEQRTYIRIEDPGHSWLVVKHRDLVNLGIEDKITPYSPVLGNVHYLEEDCDMWTFVEALKQRGVEVEIKTRVIDSFDDYLEGIRQFVSQHRQYA
jgi:hypothetical protein